MRTKKSMYNMLVAIVANALTILIGFISQGVFIKILGSEYLGLNGLFTNIISMLSIAELGFGTAIIFNLYKPLSENKKEEIKSLIQFYKKTYHVISLIILIAGIILIPFLRFIVTEPVSGVNIYIVYALFLADTVVSYLASYKRSIFLADQQNYVVNIIHIVLLIIMNIIQILCLIFTKNYYLYLVIKFSFRLFENLIISWYSNVKYPYLKEKNIKKLSKRTLSDIKMKVKALVFHQMGAFFVNGTDNLLISMFFGLDIVGLYSNYYLIISSINTIFNQAFSSITSSVGNLIVSKDKMRKDKLQVFKRLQFANFWLATFTTTSLYILMEDFISLWIGEEYLLSNVVLIALCFSHFYVMMRRSIGVFKEAAGIYYEDRFVPFIQSITNIVMSIVFAKLFGLVGIFMGTICSDFVLHFYSYPKFVYQKLFDRKRLEYIWKIMKYTLVVTISLVITKLISSELLFLNIWIRFFVNCVLCIVMPNLLCFIIYHKTEEFSYYRAIFKNIVNKITRRKKSHAL